MKQLPVIEIKSAMPLKLGLPILFLVFVNISSCHIDKNPDTDRMSKVDNMVFKLQEALDDWRENEHITGANMSVLFDTTNSTINLVSGNSKLTIDPTRFSNTPLTIDQPMFVGDITHVLIAAKVIELSEQHLIQLNQTIEIWFPTIQNAERITIRNLLEHSSGVPVFYTEEFLNQIYDKNPSSISSPEQVIDIAAKRGSFFDPGTKYGYSKTNFIILGRIIEIVTNTPIETVLRNTFFYPLGMNDTYLAGREDIPDGVPVGYEYVGPNSIAPTEIEGHVPQSPTPSLISAEWTSGALVSTPRDLLKLIQSIFCDPKYSRIRSEIIKPSIHPAQTGSTIIDSGAGVFIWNDYGEQTIGQFGFIYPFSAQFIIWTESKIAVVVIANEVDSSKNPNSNFQLPTIENLTSKVREIVVNN